MTTGRAPAPAPGRIAGASAERRAGRPAGPEQRPSFLRRRRLEAAAALAPLLGLFGLMPPFIWIFAHDGRVFGAPVALIYLLGLWVALIVAVRMLARRLLRRDAEP